MKLKLFFMIIFVLAVMLNVFAEENNIVKVLMKTSMGDIEIELDKGIAPITVDNFIGLAMGYKEFRDPATNQMTTGNFYDNLIFHRVIKDFMIQGGCPLGNGTGGPGYQFEDECYDKGEIISGMIDDEQKAILVWTQMIIPYLQNTEEPDEQIIEIYQRVQQEQSGEPLLGTDISLYQNVTGIGPLHTQGALRAEVNYGTIAMANSGPNTNGSQFFIVTRNPGADWLNGRHTVFGKVTKGMDVVHAIEDVEKGANDKPVNDVRILSVRVLDN